MLSRDTSGSVAACLEDALAASIPALAREPRPFQVLDADGRVSGYDPELSDAELLAMYRWMVFGRELDERALQLQRQGRIGVWGPMVGQEAAQVGLGLALRPGDWVFPSYRECHHPVHAGARPHRPVRVFPRVCTGRRDPTADAALFPIQIVIGDQSLHAVGAGMGFALQHQPHVAVGVIGDGATSEGDFLEALNFAGVFNAQTVLFVQNNQWAISMPRAGQTASETLAQKGSAQGMTGRAGRRQRRACGLRRLPLGASSGPAQARARCSSRR